MSRETIKVRLRVGRDADGDITSTAVTEHDIDRGCDLDDGAETCDLSVHRDVTLLVTIDVPDAPPAEESVAVEVPEAAVTEHAATTVEPAADDVGQVAYVAEPVA